jgi:hypothetical protein
MIGATQILVPVRNPRRPASKERKNAAHGASRGYERNKKLHQPRRGARLRTIQSTMIENAAVFLEAWHEFFGDNG